MHEHVAQLRERDSGPDGAVRVLGEPCRPVLFDKFARRRLTWWPEIGVGYYPVEDGSAPYDHQYFARYQAQADTNIGRALMQARVAFIARHWNGALIDIGIGSGAFIDLRNRLDPKSTATTFGYDVCPQAQDWLYGRGLFVDPYVPRNPAVSFWDVLEHIPDFSALLANVTQWVFVSIPIFHSCEHVLRSKHYRKDEHVWYFTENGFVDVMKSLGFQCVEANAMETQIGREDIGTFAFQRM